MKPIEFMKIRFVALIVSVLLVAAGLVYTFVVQKGFNLSVDFKGGLNYEITFKDKNITSVQIFDALKDSGEVEVKAEGATGSGKFAIRMESNLSQESTTVTTLDEKEAQKISNRLQSKFGVNSFDPKSDVAVSFVGPMLASQMASSSLLIGSLAILLIFAYAWFRFKFAYAVGAVVALLHDTLFMIAFIGVFRIEFTVSTIAAILTVIGYSNNDTIVIFDRIRENVGLIKDHPLKHIINYSITQTLGRSIMTSFTVFISILPMYILSTGAIQNFALNFIIGIIIGTYSSIFIASPMFFAVNNLIVKRAEKKEAAVKMVAKKA